MSWVLDTDSLSAWLLAWASDLLAAERELTELDAAIGDGDHGANMARGAARLRQVAAEVADGSGGPGPLAQAAGMALISSVGGASGPLYGTFFLRFAAVIEDGAQGANRARAEVDLPDFAAAFAAGAQGVADRGRSGAGDKTMLDVLLPVAAALQAAGGGSANAERANAESANAETANGEVAEPRPADAEVANAEVVQAEVAEPRPADATSDAARAFDRAAAVADEGLAATIPMIARKGRASYLGERSVGHADPGAASARLLVRAAARTLGAGR